MNQEKNLFEMILSDESDEGLYALSMVDKPAMRSSWVMLAEDKKPVLFKTMDEAQHIVMGAVLIPDMPVYRDWEGGLYIYFSENTIRKSHEVMMRKGLNTFTIGHEKPVPNVHLMEVWMIEDPEKDKQAIYGLKHPKGTLMVSLKINNTEVWDDYIATGDLTGFSIEGLFKMADKPESTMDDDQFLAAVKEALTAG